MFEEQTQRKDSFHVVCVWCGEQIRRDEDEDSLGTCLQCFYRIVSDQLNSRTRTSAANVFASDR